MQGEIDRLEELNTSLTNECERCWPYKKCSRLMSARHLRNNLKVVTEEAEEDKSRLETEASQVKTLYRTDLAEAEARHATTDAKLRTVSYSMMRQLLTGM